MSNPKDTVDSSKNFPRAELEAPQERPVCCGRYMYLAFTALDAFYCGTCGYMPYHPLRDGQPG